MFNHDCDVLLNVNKVVSEDSFTGSNFHFNTNAINTLVDDIGLLISESKTHFKIDFMWIYISLLIADITK